MYRELLEKMNAYLGFNIFEENNCEKNYPDYNFLLKKCDDSVRSRGNDVNKFNKTYLPLFIIGALYAGDKKFVDYYLCIIDADSFLTNFGYYNIPEELRPICLKHAKEYDVYNYLAKDRNLALVFYTGYNDEDYEGGEYIEKLDGDLLDIALSRILKNKNYDPAELQKLVDEDSDDFPEDLELIGVTVKNNKFAYKEVRDPDIMGIISLIDELGFDIELYDDGVSTTAIGVVKWDKIPERKDIKKYRLK